MLNGVSLSLHVTIVFLEFVMKARASGSRNISNKYAVSRILKFVINLSFTATRKREFLC